MSDGTPTVETLSFGTERADADSFEGYSQLYRVGTDVDRTETPFHAQVRAHRLQRMILYERALCGLLHRRDERRVRRDGFDHYALHVLVEGKLVGGPAGAEHSLRPGEVMVIDTSRPHWTRVDRAGLISVQLPRNVVDAAVGSLERHHGAILPEAAAGLLADFLTSLARRADHLPAVAVERASATAVELLGLGLSAVVPAAGSVACHLSEEAGQPWQRLRAEAYIDAHLADPRLDAAAVAAGIGVSRTSLYLAFDSGGVARVIRQRRLERLRGTLRQTGDERSVSALAYACGFTNLSHTSRAFQAAYGMPPGQYRTAIRQARRETPSGEAVEAVFARWVSELY